MPATSEWLDAAATAARLPYPALLQALREVLRDPSVQVPARSVQALPGGASLFLMPAFDARLAIAKLITYTPANAGTGRPAIQGDVVVFDIATGERRLVLDGPTVTARRTAAVSALAARTLAAVPEGPLLIVGAGAQGRSHLEAFADTLPLREVRIASRGAEGAQALAALARERGLRADVVSDPDAQLAHCPLVVTATPADAVVLSSRARGDAFIAAVGAFTPRMRELSADLCQQCAEGGGVWLDSEDARHEAGDLMQAGLPLEDFPTLAALLEGTARPRGSGPVLFKSCGWGGWDLAAARAAVVQA
ncbi:delta(1)-pyrroline-2-carboxylate reductase family protein [Ramlibacter rhizophilus]|uniref:Delta(1)-pyrroline-2-carboxylate reductase family protein n=1 Tax=Ramlibacter rhizophilus TaxID=1781167 RepID=A0A4Z0BPX7_9BURK|nr:delta(1)-pyrroline-2-carboxylate reductase family protein [Ramlibacter rhizophilus]TFZ01376.1 delta(1)-pyrroline-2-carboxylate reductase family protein [Ramlibacter rhizophilus]